MEIKHSETMLSQWTLPHPMSSTLSQWTLLHAPHDVRIAAVTLGALEAA